MYKINECLRYTQKIKTLKSKGTCFCTLANSLVFWLSGRSLCDFCMCYFVVGSRSYQIRTTPFAPSPGPRKCSSKQLFNLVKANPFIIMYLPVICLTLWCTYLNVLISGDPHMSFFVFSWKLWLRCWVVVLQEPLLSGRGWGGEPGKDVAGGSSFLSE